MRLKLHVLIEWLEIIIEERGLKNEKNILGGH